MDTIDCLTECPKCHKGFIKAYSLTELTTLDTDKKYGANLCVDCVTIDSSPPYNIMDAYNTLVSVGYSNIVNATKALKDFWGV